MNLLRTGDLVVRTLRPNAEQTLTWVLTLESSMSMRTLAQELTIMKNEVHQQGSMT